MDAAVRWLLFEGMLPLVGTALLYWALLVCFAVVEAKNSMNFKWHEGIDSMGWLYGAAVLAIQTGFKGWGVATTGPIPWFCWAASIACFLLLIAAIFAKAADGTWQPKARMKWGATILTGLVLLAGFRTHQLLLELGGGS